jgi:hypothetical protein
LAEAVDCAAITSQQAAQDCARAGQLVQVFLFPLELGGENIPQNIVYLPPHAGTEKERTTKELIALVQAGTVNKASVVPEYRGDSFVPARIFVTAWRDGEPVHCEMKIEVW